MFLKNIAFDNYFDNSEHLKFFFYQLVKSKIKIQKKKLLFLMYLTFTPNSNLKIIFPQYYNISYF